MSVQVSSTGSLGASFRSDERAYLNFPEAVNANNQDDFRDAMQDYLFSSYEDGPDEVTRSVVRAVVDSSAAQELLMDEDTAVYVEAAVALPSDESDESGEHVLYFARNRGSRAPSATSAADIKRVLRQAPAMVEASSRNKRQPLNANEYSLTNTIQDPEQLFALWGNSFGWTQEGCEEFAAAIRHQQDLRPEDRQVWFKGLERRGQLVSSAMAERLDMPSKFGSIAFIEHTEWSATEELRGKGLGRTVVGALSETLHEDLAAIRRLVYAECNITSGAHVVALHAGFSVPEVESATGRVGQVLHHNVRIGDGYEPVGGYRSFAFVVAAGTK